MGKINWLCCELFNNAFPENLELIPANSVEVGKSEEVDDSFRNHETLTLTSLKILISLLKMNKKRKTNSLKEMKLKVYESFISKIENEKKQKKKFVKKINLRKK